MIFSQFVSRFTLLRDRADWFDRYPFSLPAIRTPEHEDAEHFKVTRHFLSNPGRMLKILMER